jgi:Icc-related predicted phosphoesterase
MQQKHLLIAADCHGNISQYDEIFAYARNPSCSGIVICGDVFPKNGASVKEQRGFLLGYLFSKIETLQRASKDRTMIYLMMGNDDFRANEPLLLEKQNCRGEYRYTYIHNKIVSFGDYYIAGYSFVPPTPFTHKGGERIDGAGLRTNRGDFRLSGLSPTVGENIISIDLSTIPSIQQELTVMFSGHRHFNKTIFACHAPPYNTNLDCHHSGFHVGSAAISEHLS